VAVICAGAKAILDVARTFEALETLGVPVFGYSTDEFPGFYMRSTGVRLSARVESAPDAATLLRMHWNLDGGGVVIAQPVRENLALSAEEIEQAVLEGERQAKALGIRGSALTPFLQSYIADATSGRAVQVNRDLVVANARLAAQIALALHTPGQMCT